MLRGYVANITASERGIVLRKDQLVDFWLIAQRLSVRSGIGESQLVLDDNTNRFLRTISVPSLFSQNNIYKVDSPTTSHQPFTKSADLFYTYNELALSNQSLLLL